MFHSSDLHPRPPMSSPAISAPPEKTVIDSRWSCLDCCYVGH